MLRVATALALVVPLAGPTVAQELAPCAEDRYGPRAECGTLLRPERQDDGESRTIGIAFAVLRAERRGGEAPVFLFAGGPGQGSTALADLVNGPFAGVRATRDVVLVDQRGTGGSNPLPCERDVQASPPLAFGHVFEPALFAECRVRLTGRADLALYVTDLAVADIDAVRAHLGYHRVLVWGGSYGTRMAQAYMRRHPERVVAAVLDGVVPFDFGAPSTYARSAQAALDRVLRDCAAQPACDRAHPDLGASFQRLLSRLRGGPVPATVRGPKGDVAVSLSAGDFAYAVRGILYNSNRIRRLPGMIHRAAATGDLSEFAQAYWERAAGFQGEFADGLHFSVFCAEDVAFVPDAEARRLAKGTFFEDYLWDEYAGTCRDWPRGRIAPDFRTPLESAIPTLLLSGAYDPVTPPETGARVARSLSNARHLVIPNQAHGAGFDCARPAVLHVLLTGRLEGLPEVCAGVGPIDLTPPA